MTYFGSFIYQITIEYLLRAKYSVVAWLRNESTYENRKGPASKSQFFKVFLRPYISHEAIIFHITSTKCYFQLMKSLDRSLLAFKFNDSNFLFNSLIVQKEGHNLDFLEFVSLLEL